MLIFESQREARVRTRQLLLAFALTVLLLVLAVNGALLLAWHSFLGFTQPLRVLPPYFVEVNTGVTLLFVLGGWWLETSQLAGSGSVRLAEQMGARELRPSGDFDEQRFGNIVQEMAIASGLTPPRPMVMARRAGINAFATGWDEEDAVIAVTQGALDYLTREELQGLVAHELSHIREGDTRLNMRLVGMVFGLEMVYRFGERIWGPDPLRDRRLVLSLMGLAIMAAGWLGWVAGHALQASVSRQREYLADARAVQWTRSKDGLGGVLRKVLGTQRVEDEEVRSIGSPMQHLLLVSTDGDRVAHWLDSHPTLEQRIRRIYGRPMGPLPLARDDAARPLATDTFSPAPAATGVKPPDEWTLS